MTPYRVIAIFGLSLIVLALVLVDVTIVGAMMQEAADGNRFVPKFGLCAIFFGFNGAVALCVANAMREP